ncbi:MAG: hypothetical protein ISR99_02095 [Parcubacteria group bacterium]|nr:hypothetical protein [Parcubacteria group bacterium]
MERILKQIKGRAKHKYAPYAFAIVAAGLIPAAYLGISELLPTSYEVADVKAETVKKKVVEDSFVVTHLDTPEAVRAIYMSQCVVGTPDFRARLVKLVEETELNSIIIDVKDYSGKLAFPTDHPLLKDSVSDECGARDMKEFLGLLHSKNIYTIARITAFQDPHYTKLRPDLAVAKESATTTPWTDHRGLSFIDVGATPFWDYLVAVGEEAYGVGFDELNFDYVRFPSDGNMRDIYYPISEEFVVSDPELGKARVLRSFFSYLSQKLKPTGAILSADLFGMTTTNTDDLNIGQILEYADPYFDYIAPMVYPSHYPKNFLGLDNPNKNIYKVIHYSMSEGVRRLTAASSTPSKLRPWLQDFDYGGNYGEKEVREQIQATYDTGLTSWMLWDPSNVYTKEALLPN